MSSFRSWLHRINKVSEMVELPSPGKGWNLNYSTMKKPPQWSWIKAGEKLRPAYTPDDNRLYDKSAVHPSQNPPEQPKMGQPSMMNQSRTWFLATYKSDPKVRVALTLGSQGNWEFIDAKGKRGAFTKEQVGQTVQRVTDAQNQVVKGSTAEEVLNKDLNVQQAQGVPASQAEDRSKRTGPVSPFPEDNELPPSVAGKRLPTNQLNEYGAAIRQAFLGDPNVPQVQKPHMVMDALAGCGKTTMLKDLTTFLRPGEKALYLVFNKKNQLEAEIQDPNDPRKGFPHVGSQVIVKTTHSFLGDILARNEDVVPKTTLPPEYMKGTKLSHILQDPDKTWYEKTCLKLGVEKYHMFTIRNAIKTLAERAKNYAISPDDPEIETKLNGLIDKFMIDTTVKHKAKSNYRSKWGESEPEFRETDYRPQILELTTNLLKQCLPGRSLDSKVRGMRDHDDTLWFVALNADKMQFPKLDIALADEVQDFNVCQQIMLEKLSGNRDKGGAGSRIICVGDPNQAIYRFRGADSDSFKTIREKFGGKENTFSLPVNFRCAEQIIDYVNGNTHVNNLKTGRMAKGPDGKPVLGPDGKPQFHQGVVTTNQRYQESMQNLIGEFGENGTAKMQTAMICRNNKPLVTSALSLLKNGIPFVIVGRDFADSMIKMVNSLMGRQRPDIRTFKDSLRDKLAELKDELSGHPDLRKVDKLKEDQEWAESLMSVLDFTEVRQGGQDAYVNPVTKRPIETADDFANYIKAAFGGLNLESKEQDIKKYQKMDKKKTVILTTAHRSKGLEFERVFILNNKMFDKTASGSGKPMHPEDIQQEANAKYVAYTRAETELHILADDVA